MSWDLQRDRGVSFWGSDMRPIVMGWKEPESEPELKMCYPHEVIRDLGTLFQLH